MMSRHLLLCLFASILMPSKSELCGSGSLYPYGPDVGDISLTSGDDGNSLPFFMPSDLPFYGSNYHFAYANINGLLSFTTSVNDYLPSMTSHPVPFVSPIWTDAILDPGVMYWRVTTAADVLVRADGDVLLAGGSISDLQYAIVVTWHGLTSYPAGGSPSVNTFQCVLVTNGAKTYAILNYEFLEWEMNWGQHAVAAFNKGGNSDIAHLSLSGTHMMLELELYSSVGLDGRVVVRVDPPTITPLALSKEKFSCTMSLTGAVHTYDGASLQAAAASGKSMISASKLGNTNPCKLQLRMKTSAKGKVDWLIVNAGVHSNPKKWKRTFELDQKHGLVTVNGQGIGKKTISSFPYNWSNKGTNITIDGDGDDGWQVTSSSCPFCIYFRPRSPEPIFKIKIAGMYLDHVKGLCQNGDGDISNDAMTCQNVDVGGLPDYVEQIADSCI